MNLLDLFVKIGLDDQVSSKIGGIAEGIKGGLGSAAKVGAKALGGVATAAVAGAGAIGKAALDGYADYEQLVGGVDKLYGDASEQLQAYAAEAYKTSGMSANDYMETATSFSASLIGSLAGDTQAAAEMTDLAMRDMSDNVNTFGTDAEAVQNAYMGFSKANFTMLDNLKLGYGGTQQEMQRLLDDAMSIKAANGEMAEYSIDSFADIVEAIHVVQEEQHIAGTTANEAASTIAGSMTMASTAWDNLLTAVANPDADLDQMVTNFTDSVQAVIDNVLPRIQAIGEGIAQALPAVVDAVLPMVSTLLGQLIPVVVEILPSLISAVSEVITEVTNYLPELIPVLVTGAITLFGALVDGVSQNAPAILEAVGQAVTDVVNAINGSEDMSLQDAGMELLGKLINGVSEKSAELYAWFSGLVGNAATWIGENWDAISAKGGEIAGNILSGIVSGAEAISTWAGELAGSVATWVGENWETITAKGSELAGKILEGIVSGAEALTTWAGELAGSVATWIGENWETITAKGGEIIGAVVSGIQGAASGLMELIQGIPGSVVAWLGENWPDIQEKGGAILQAVITGLSGAASGLMEFIQAVPGSIAAWLGENWPTIQEKGGALLQAVITGISGAASGLMEFIQAVPGSIVTWLGENWPSIQQKGNDLLQAVISGIGEAAPALMGFITSIPGSIVTWIGDNWPGIVAKGQEIIGGLLDGIKNAFGIDLTQPDSVLKFVQSIPGKIVEFIGGVGSTLLQVGKDVIGGMLSGIKAVFSGEGDDTVISFITGIPGMISGWLGELDPVGWLVEVGGNVIQGFVDGIQNFNLRQAIIDTFGPAGEIACNVLGINSPSTVFKEIGDYTMQGMKEGLEGGESDVDNALSTIAGGLPEEFVDAYWTMHDQGAALMQSFGTGLSNAFYGGYGTGSVVDTISSIGGNITSYFTAGYHTLYGAGQQIALGLNDGIVSVWNNTIIPNLQTITRNIPDWKGPLDKDKRLLVENGEAIMEGLAAGIDNGADRLYDQLGTITSGISGAAGYGSAQAAVGRPSVTINFDGARLSFRNRSDMEEFAELLGDYMTSYEMGSVA